VNADDRHPADRTPPAGSVAFTAPAGRRARIRNPLGIPAAAVNALVSVGELAALGELRTLRESIEPVSSAAEPVARLRERLPGGN
jgi:hypothetical protein